MTKSLALIFLILTTCQAARTAEPLPRYFGARPGSLADAKARLARGDRSLQPALTSLVEEAKEALRVPPPSVMDKSRTPPSGDKHDYLSVGPYWWPNPASSNGLPYIRHDGEVNPESRDGAFDLGRVRLMARLG